MLQVLLKDVESKLGDWRPNDHIREVEDSLRKSGGKAKVSGCKFGHPKDFTSALCSELTNLSQSVYYVLERELLTLPDLQGSGGLRLLHALDLILRSQYNQAVFLDAGGLQSTSKIIRNGINQLHVCTTTSPEANQDKIGYLCTLLIHCFRLVSPYLDSDNIVSKEFAAAKGSQEMHPLIVSNVCSSQMVADYVELLRIIKRSKLGAQNHRDAIFTLQSLVLGVITTSYKINSDTDLLDAGIIEAITSLLGQPMETNRSAGASDSAFFQVQNRALEVLATASQKHAVIVQHFLQSDGIVRLNQWMGLILGVVTEYASHGDAGEGGGESKIVEAAFKSLEMQVGVCKDNERFVEALLRGVFGILETKADALWAAQWRFLEEGASEEDESLALRVLEFKKHVLKWVAVVLLTSKHAIGLLRRHKCWETLLGKNFFRSRLERQRLTQESRQSLEGARTAPRLAEEALECQAMVSSLLYKALTSPWNAMPETELKVVLAEAHALALQPGSLVQLLSVLRKYVNSFRVARTETILNRADASSGLARIIQKQKQSQEEDWETLVSDQTYLGGIFERHGGQNDAGGEEGDPGLSIQTQTRIHVLRILKDCFGCTLGAEEYFVKQWSAVGALFTLIWEQAFQETALGLVKSLLRLTPSNTDSEIAKSVLFTRYVEALPRAQAEIHTSGLSLVFLLLEGIQETIVADQAHQRLFNECETILQVFNLLNEDFTGKSEGEGPELCRSVLKTLGYLISGNRQGRKHLERTVGWDTMQELIFHCVQAPIPYSIFSELFHIATDQILAHTKGAKPRSIHFVSVKLVPTMLNILRKSTREDASKGLDVVHSILRQSIANCSSCDYYGVTAQLFDWFRECESSDRDIQDRLVRLIGTIGEVSLSAKDLRTVLRTCYGCQAAGGGAPLDEVKLLQTVSILRNVASQEGPTDFLDLDGVQSGLRWQGKSSWGGSKSYSFSVWLRFDTSNLQQTQGKVLYTLHGRAGKADQYSVVAVLESRRILIHTIESKLHSVSLEIDVPVGSWFHLGIVHDNSSTFGSSSVTLYVNGVKENTEKLKYPRNFDVLTGISVGSLAEEDTSHSMCRWLSRLKGQVSSIFLFQDALYEKHMMQIYRIGPNVAFTRIIKGFSTGEMLFLALKEKANSSGVLHNVVQPGAPIGMTVLEGTHVCCTRVMTDMIQCIGGIGVVLTLFGQLYDKYASSARVSETLSSMLTQVFQLLEKLMGGSHLYTNDMVQMEGLPILGFLIRSVDAGAVQPGMVSAIEEMLVWMVSTYDKTIFSQAFEHILLDLSWWSRVTDQVQRPYIELLLRTLRTEYNMVREIAHVYNFLDALRGLKDRCFLESGEEGDQICKDLIVRGYLEAVVILLERKVDDSDLIALFCFCNDMANEDVTFLLLRRVNAHLKSDKAQQKALSDILSRVGGPGLLKPLAESTNTLVCAEALETLLLVVPKGTQGEDLVTSEVLLQDFGNRLSSASLGAGFFQKLVALLNLAQFPEAYAVSVLFQIMPQGESKQRKVVLSYCVKLLSKTRYNVEAFMKKSAWQRPLVGKIVDNLHSLPPQARVALSKTGGASEVTISWNILVSLMFYCVRYKENGSDVLEQTFCHFLWCDRYRKEEASIYFPQLVSDVFKMVLLSDQVTRSASDSWTTVEALDCEACVNNILAILPLCQDILLGIFASGQTKAGGEGGGGGGGDEKTGTDYDAVDSLRSISMGKNASALDLCKELGFGDHLFAPASAGGGGGPDDATESAAAPVHEDLSAEFCEVCVSLIYKLCLGHSAGSFAKYVSKEERDGTRESPPGESAGSPQSPSRAAESFTPQNLQCVFQVTMYLFTNVVNTFTEAERAKVIVRDICGVVEYCIASSELLSNDLSIYIVALDHAKDCPSLCDWQRESCASVHHSLSYAALKGGPERDLSKLLTTETIYRARAEQDRMIRVSSLKKQVEEDCARDLKSNSDHGNSVMHLSRGYSEQDASRRHSETMNQMETHQEVQSRWKHIQRKLQSEKGIWASERAEKHLKWKLDSTEDYVRRRMKVKRLYTVREYLTSSSLSEEVANSASPDDDKIIDTLSAVKALKVNSAADLTAEALQEGQDFQESEEGAQVSPDGNLSGKLQRSDSVTFADTAFASECKLVTVKRVVPGKIHVDQRRVYFSGKVQEHSNLFGKGAPDPSFGKTKRICLSIGDIREIHFMRYMLEHSACEIFLKHKSIFLAFETRDEMKRAVKRITLVASPSLLVVTRRKRQALAELYSSQWRKGEISNFSYLMKLNTLAGRTYNDLSQYPVFPWILRDYQSDDLDLGDPRIYRDLSKPIGALNEKRKALVVERYNLTAQTDDPARAFHYGSHYSTAGVILYYLIRMEPFTFLHSVLQGGKLDHADRLFNSVQQTWEMCNTHSADLKELIPEFFCLPEIFENVNTIDFGLCQDGLRHSEVTLPPWAKGSAVEFVKIHKRALESEFVSSNLHSWVDLIFGYKQRGKHAVAAVNVFHYLSYEGSVDLTAIQDDRERKVVTDHVLHFGQTPSQLFQRKQSPKTAKAKSSTWSAVGGVSSGGARTTLTRRQISPPRPIRHLAWLEKSGKVVVIDQDARIHYFRLTTPKDTSFTFSASASGDYSLDFDRTTDVLRKQCGSTIVRMGKVDNQFALLSKHSVLLTMGHWDNSIRCYNLDDFKCVQSVSCHKDAITCVAVDLEETMVVTGSRDTTVIVWKICGGKRSGAKQVVQENPSHILYGHQDEVSCVGLSAPLDLVVSASVGGDILMHTLGTGTYVRQLKVPSGRGVPRRMAMSTDGVIVLHCDSPSLVSMTVNGKILSSADTVPISDLGFTKDGLRVVVGGKGTLMLRDAHSLQVSQKFEGVGGEERITSVRGIQGGEEDVIISASKAGEVMLCVSR